MKLGILHPGAMGSALGATATVPVYWVGESRSVDTRERAAASGLVDVGSITELAASADVIVAVCPPHAALQVAATVVSSGFEGIYVDANAVSPETAARVGAMFTHFVDGGIIGPPPTQPGTTRLYLAGPEATTVATIWDGSPLDARVLTGDAGAASALKMAYAGWTKGSTALLMAMRAYAAAAGVGDELIAEWELSIPELPGRLESSAARSGPKAWRFADEMAEIASSLGNVDLPSAFHEAAEEVFRRLSSLKGLESPTVDDVLALLGHQASPG